MDITSHFKSFISTWLPCPSDKILVAVSGGIDSMVLLRLCVDAGLNVGLAHCNYNLRGTDSLKDEVLVKETARYYNLPCFSEQFDTNTFATVHKLSIQAAARRIRYAFFEEIMQREGFKFLFTAHHADDNAETVLHNFLKGTGIAGLHGIPPVNKNIFRPLIAVSKQDIKAFAQSANIAYREDASNSLLKYTRNFLRNEIIPRLRDYYPGITDNLLDNVRRFSTIENFYHHALKKQIGKLVVLKGNELHIPVLKLLSIPGYEALLFEILSQYGFKDGQIQNVIGLTKSQSGKFVSSDSHRVLRNRSWLIVSPLQQDLSGHFLISETDKEVQFPGGILRLKIIEGNDFKDEGERVIYTDIHDLKFPLLLRRWRQGDYFYPMGLLKSSGKPAKKKISRFMNDRKMSIVEKEKQWVIESGNRIIWLAGIRGDHRYRVGAKTTRMLRLELSPQ